MGRYDKIATAKKGGFSSNFLELGEYFVRLDAVKERESEDPQKPAGTFYYIVELTVIHSFDEGGSRVGAECAWISDLGKGPSFGDIREFIASALDVDFEEVEPADVELSIAPGQPLAGYFMHLKTLTRPTKKGGVWTKHKWLGPVSADELERLLPKSSIDRFFEGGALLEEMRAAVSA